MSKLLLDENPLLIMPKLACTIGLNESIVLQQIHYWLKINEKVKNNLKDGYYWTYNTYSEWQEQFPFWSIKTIQRTIKNLEDKNLVITGNYNKMKADRTKWYRIDYTTLDNIEKHSLGQNDFTKECSCGQNDLMDKTICPNGEDNMTSPLPETTPEITTKTNPIEGVVQTEIREGTPKGDTKSIPFYDFLLKDIKRYNTSYKLEIVETIIYYYGKYFEKFNKEHFRYSAEQLKEIYSRLDTIFDIGIQDNDYNKMLCVDSDTLKEVIDKHFVTNYSGNMSWTLLSFLNDNVLKNRCYEVGCV